MDTWLTLVHRGEVLEAYRIFLGLMQNEKQREQALAQLVFAGLMDVQDRVLWNRSYTTGHKSYRARATTELGRALGWENAHDVLYAGALDIEVGPRWYSTYEFACNTIKMLIDDETLRAIPYAGASAREETLWKNTGILNQEDIEETVNTLIYSPEPANVEQIVKLLCTGKSPKSIIETIQVAAAQILTATKNPKNFSIPQHCYEYCNTVGWYFDNFEHIQQLKLLFMAATFVGRNAMHQRETGETTEPDNIKSPNIASTMSAERKLTALDRALLELDSQASLSWTQACLENGVDPNALIEILAGAATKIGNDPHNQEIALCLLEDYRRSGSPRRDDLLFACVQHTASHQKYGDHLECYHRYCNAFDLNPSV